MKMLRYAMAFAIGLSVLTSSVVLTSCTDEAVAPLRTGEDEDDYVPPPPPPPNPPK